MRYKLFSILLLILMLIAVCIVGAKKTPDSTQYDSSEIYLENLMQYKMDSIKDTNALNKLLNTLELGEYLVDIEVTDKEHEGITIYYDCTEEENVLNYYKNFNRLSILQKNSVTLFALINKLDKVSYNFNISDAEIAKKYHLGVSSDTNKFQEKNYSYTRKEIEQYYNQDVRRYVEDKSEFMKYNIDLNTNNITIYLLDYNLKEYNILEITLNDKYHIENIIQYIDKENFSVPDAHLNGICKIWMDLNNGFIIGVYGVDNYGVIIRGDGKDIFADGENKLSQISNYVYKILPNGLEDYIEDIIENVN